VKSFHPLSCLKAQLALNKSLIRRQKKMCKITAYSDTVSCRGGDVVGIKVSAEGTQTFDAELRRIVQGDTNPEGPGYRDELVPLALGGPFAARRQEIRTGSYGVVHEADSVSTSGSFTIAAMIWPTLPGEGQQTIFSIGNSASGCSLFLAESGVAAFEVRDEEVAAVVETEGVCRARAWYLIVGSYDSQRGTIQVSQIPLEAFPGVRDSGENEAVCDVTASIKKTDTITFGGSVIDDETIGRFFNGKIEGPEIYHSVEEASALFRAIVADEQRPVGLVAHWDFSQEMDGDTFVDRGPNSLNGRFVNLPHRAVSGFRWNGEEYRWNDRPEHYSAVHFHDDDLYDAGWETDFFVTLPEDLKSGVYAVRLFCEHEPSTEYFVVFCVKAGVGAKRKPIAFVLPTASYMAYANHRFGLDYSETEIAAGQLVQIGAHHRYMQEHPELGLSLYDLHRDGSVVFYSSRLRPMLDFQPKVQGFIGGQGSNIWQFNADTHILGFLEHRGIEYDVVTDEDLDREGVAALSGYRVVLTGSHPEYTSTNMLDTYKTFLEQGGRVFYAGGNGFYWRIAYSQKLLGVIECRRAESGIRGGEPGVGNYWHQFTKELGGLWRRIGRPPQELFGVGMTAQGFDLSSPYIRTEDSMNPRVEFVFAGVEGDVLGDFGLNGNGAAGNEIDRADFALGTPPHALIVASSRNHTDLYLATPEDTFDPLPTSTGSQSHTIRADLTFFETHAGGAVFSTGSIAWAGSMAWNRYENQIATITENVLRRFADPRPFDVGGDATI
jgi:N,N-dimethylformamidase